MGLYSAAQTQIKSDVKAECYNIAVLHNIFFAFQADQTFFTSRCHGSTGNQIVKGYDFGTNKALFKVGMDFSGGFGSFGPTGNRPGMDIIRSGSQEGNQASSA